MDEGDDALLAALNRLVADELAADAATERAKARILRRAAEESATFAGVAVELAERAEVVVARMTTGRSHRGTVLAVGRDFLVLGDPPGPPALLAMAAVAWLRPQPTARRPVDTAGDRRAPLDVALAVLLAGLAGDRPRVQMVASGDAQLLSGELRAVGLDVATLRLDGEQTALAYVRISGLAEVILVDHD